MQRLIASLTALVLGMGSPCFGKPYGNHDPRLLLKSGDPTNGISPSINLKIFDEMLEDIGVHARNYPTKFDSPADKTRATRDTEILLKVCETLIENGGKNPSILRRAGFLNSVGHNLDIKGCAPKANDFFRSLLEIEPSDPAGNFMYGVFLGGVGRGREAIPYLEKALSQGVTDANYSLGMSNLMIGKKDKALAFFKKDKETNPNNPDIEKIISAIEKGQMGIKHLD